MACFVFFSIFFLKVVHSEVTSNDIVRTQYSWHIRHFTSPSANSFLLSRAQGAKACSFLCASHTLGNHWKKYILHPKYYSKTLPKKKKSPNVNKIMMFSLFKCFNKAYLIGKHILIQLLKNCLFYDKIWRWYGKIYWFRTKTTR